MKMKNMWKRFWTLDVHNHAGFTLVELIIVIAILAILSTGAIAGYSAYITSANKTADQAMIAEIKNVLTLAYYSGDLAENGYIVLSADGVANYDDIQGTEIDTALINAYGANWNTALKLKYADWKGMTSDQKFAAAYQASSFNGNEDALIVQLGSVTNLLKDALGANTGLVGSSFNSYLSETGVDTDNNQEVSNAAILYAANTIGNLEDTAAVDKAFDDFYAGTTDLLGLTNALKDELGTFGAAAALYAHGEAFGQYAASKGNTVLLEDFHDIDVDSVSDSNAALNKVMENLGAMVNAAMNDENLKEATNEYMAGQYSNDVSAYLETMKKIDANANKFAEKLGNADCYTDGTAAALLQAAIAAGSMDVSCNDGEVAIWILDGLAGDSVSDIQG